MAKGNGGTRGSNGSRTPLSGGTLFMSSLLGYSLPDYVEGKDVRYEIAVETTKLRRKILIAKDLYKGGDSSISFNEYVKNADIPTTTVKLSNIISQQGYVKTDVVNDYIAGKKGDDTAPVIGFKVYGTQKIILVNGNHRVAATALQGGKMIKMKVINAPKEFYKYLQK